MSATTGAIASASRQRRCDDRHARRRCRRSTATCVATVAALGAVLGSSAEAFAPAAGRPSLVGGVSDSTMAFVPRRTCHRFVPLRSTDPVSPRSIPLVIRHMSDVGGGTNDRRPPPGGGGGGKGKGDEKMDDFLDGEQNPESDNLRRVRERLAEDSLPISFGYEAPEKKDEKKKNGRQKEEAAADDDDDDDDDESESVSAKMGESESDTAAKTDRGDLVRRPGGGGSAGASPVGFAPPGAEDVLALADNPYLDVVSRLSPSDVISKFTSTANPRVQDAVRTTILNLIGNLPKLGFDTATVTTGERLASVMFQLQMTGYMFKNAEYRLSLTQSLGMTKPPSAYGQMAKDGFLLEGSKNGAAAGIMPDMGEELAVDKDELEDEDAYSRGKVRGKIRVKYGAKQDKVAKQGKGDEKEAKEGDDPVSPAGEMEVEVDAEAYLTELRSEVTRLRDNLTLARKTKEDALRKDLLQYIRTMSKDEMQGLTGTMSPDVLGAMKGLVNVVMAGIGEGRIGPETVTEQSSEAMAQLCMWQLVVGYNLRELEVREEMRAALKGSVSSSSGKGESDDDEEEDEFGSAFM